MKAPTWFCCPDCGSGIAVDEDGCCIACGLPARAKRIPATALAIDKQAMRLHIAALKREVRRLERRLRANGLRTVDRWVTL